MEINKPSWRLFLQAAAQEPDPGKAEAKARAAEAAIFNRMRETRPGPGFEEEQELFNALESIRVLKTNLHLRLLPSA